MVRIVLDLAVDTAEADAVESHVDEFLSHMREHWTTQVARRDVVAAPNPDQAKADMIEAKADMIEGYRGG